MSNLTIGTPKVVYDGDKVRLTSNISGDFINEEMFFEVDKGYGQYLCYEQADAFLVALIPYVLYRSKKEDVLKIYVNAPVSKQLYFQLQHILFPALVNSIEIYDDVEIICELTNDTYEADGVGTGVSGGVDSFYTLEKSKKEYLDEYKIKYGLYWETVTQTETMKGIIGFENKVKRICSGYGINPVSVKCNIVNIFYSVAHDAVISYMNAAIVLSLQKLFKIFYISSTFTYDEFKIVHYASSQMDPILVHCLSNETLSLYSVGSETSRIEKTQYISNAELARNELLVCGPMRQNNCSVCAKCTRTMIDLELKCIF